MLGKAIYEATTNIAFLRVQLAEGQDPALREVVTRLLEAELQKLVAARGREEFAFRMPNYARPPVRSHRPDLRFLAGAGLAGGFMLSLVVVLLVSLSRRSGT